VGKRLPEIRFSPVENLAAGGAFLIRTKKSLWNAKERCCNCVLTLLKGQWCGPVYQCQGPEKAMGVHFSIGEEDRGRVEISVLKQLGRRKTKTGGTNGPV